MVVDRIIKADRRRAKADSKLRVEDGTASTSAHFLWPALGWEPNIGIWSDSCHHFRKWMGSRISCNSALSEMLLTW